MKGIADTGFLVAFANRADHHHDWAVRVAEGVHEPLLTCEAVLAETAFHLRSVEVVLAMLQQGLAALAFDCREHLAQLEALARRYTRHSVITVYRKDFRVYRRNKRETFPLICPPEP